MSGLFSGTPLERPLTCERCGQTHAACQCPRDRLSGKVLDPRDQPLRIRREKRSGKMLTVITGFAPRSDRTNDLPALLKHFRTSLGTGGSIGVEPVSPQRQASSSKPSSPTIELQGDHRDKALAYLQSLGYPAKAAGG